MIILCNTFKWIKKYFFIHEGKKLVKDNNAGVSEESEWTQHATI